MEEVAGMAPDRSPPLHPQIQASAEGGGVARRRSTRLHTQVQAGENGAGVTCRPQIQEGEDGAGVARRRSPRLHLQIHASEEDAGVTPRRILRRRGKSPAEPVSLPDDDDMLREILLRLPPQPSSLPRASAVCRRWWGLITDARFHRQFRAHHRNPPLLGFFQPSHEGTVFNPVLDPPDRIPPQRVDLGRYGGRRDCPLLDCRHGRVLIQDLSQREVVVCDPITRVQRRVPIPPEFRNAFHRGAVLCAAADHVHGSCHSSPFKVVLVSIYTHDNRSRSLTCVYSSDTGLWGNLVSAEAACSISFEPAGLVGNCLYWLSFTDVIHEFDLDENSLTMIRGPPVPNGTYYGNRQIMQAADGALGYAILSYPRFEIWQRNINGHGAATWMLWKTIEMNTIPGLPPRIEERMGRDNVRGYDEDTDELFLYVNGSVYVVQLKLLQSRKLYESYCSNRLHHFKSFYTPGTSITG